MKKQVSRAKPPAEGDAKPAGAKSGARSAKALPAGSAGAAEAPRADAATTGAHADAGASAVDHAIALQHMERIRAIEFARLELERKLELAQERQLELATDASERALAITVELNQARRDLAQAQADAAKAVALAEKRHAEVLRREEERHQQAESQLQKRLTLIETELGFSSATIRETRKQLEDVRQRHQAMVAEQKASVLAITSMDAERAAERTLMEKLGSDLAVAREETAALRLAAADAATKLDAARQQNAAELAQLQRESAEHLLRLRQEAAAQLDAARAELASGLASSKQAADERLDAAQHAAEARLQSARAEAAATIARLGEQLDHARSAANDAAEKAAAREQEMTQSALVLNERNQALDRERAALLERIAALKAEHARTNAAMAERIEASLLSTGRLQEALRQAEASIAESKLALAALAGERDTLQSELAETRTSLAQRGDELAAAREAGIELESRVMQLEESTRYGVGDAMVSAATSWHGFVRLPVRLWRLARRARQRQAIADVPPAIAPAEQQKTVEAVLAMASSEGIAQAEAFLAARQLEPFMRAHALTALAKAAVSRAPADAIRLGAQAQALDPRDYREKWLAFLRYDVGQVRAAATALATIPRTGMSASERAKVNQVLGHASLLESPPVVPALAVPAPEVPVPGRMLYVAASVRPFHQSGYTLRTHALLTALARSGIDLCCVARPGYPDDRADAQPADVGTRWERDGVTYTLLPKLDRRRLSADRWLAQAADALFELGRELRPAVIHAASNHENALPALFAARRLGVPFVYEVRGLWEYTAASRLPDWEASERFGLERMLETLVATQADRVLALNQALANEMVARGVDPAKIALAPNAIDPTLHRPQPRDPALAASIGLREGAFVVGYAGSLVGYEGLDDLVAAISLLAADLPHLQLLIVGDGEQKSTLEALAARLGVADRVVFTGRVPAERVPELLAQCDGVVLPRKAFAVCELVTPIKALEAMAMGLPLIASAVAPLAELVEHGVTGLLHTPCDPASLAEAISALAHDPALAERLATEARERVLSGATWDLVAERVTAQYRGIAEGFQPREATPPNPLPIPSARNTLTADEKLELERLFAAAYTFGGAETVRSVLAAQAQGHSARFHAFCALKAASRCQEAGDIAAAAGILEEALAASPDPATIKGAATLFHNVGDDLRALALVEQLEAEGCADEALQRISRQVRGRVDLARQAAQAGLGPAFEPVPRRCVNFLHFSLPYASVGYATRSHGIAMGVKAAGWDIRPCTRPGFPQDFKPELEGMALPESDEIDGITYRRLLEGGRRGVSEPEYLLAAADRCEQVLRLERPEIVHAASNYSTALPALIAARRVGVPFVYEVRGFWEVTRSSRDGEFEKSNKYRAMQLLEALVLDNADHVITITGAMREDLMSRGVPDERISLAYNSVDPERFQPVAADRGLAERIGIPDGVPVIGYVGSFVDYEGLDDLVLAAAMLRRKGVDFRLLLVGDGEVMPQLRALIESEGLADVAVVTGRVPHEEVESYYSLIDIAPFPRKPWQVCELVSPLKPFEAMAMEKAVVVSGTRALLEIVRHGHNGIVFEKGSVESLAHALQRLVADPALRRTLGRQSREWVCEYRSWNRAGRDIVEAYGRLSANGPRR